MGANELSNILKEKGFLENSDVDSLVQNRIRDQILNLSRRVEEVMVLHDANPYFNKMLEIQELLSVVLFKFSIPVDQDLERFTREFDRGDTLEVRKIFFKKIKSFGENWLSTV